MQQSVFHTLINSYTDNLLHESVSGAMKKYRNVK